MEYLGGKTGEVFAALAFSASLVSMASWFFAEKRKQSESLSWSSLGKITFLLHGIGVFGIVITLFTLIATHQFQYHYVWAHSSRELPWYFMLSCFWEGQEGSFLLWQMWHVVLGTILLFRLKEWRNPVMFVISAVQAILSSMVLGVYLSESTSALLYALGLAAPAAWLLYDSLSRSQWSGTRGLLSTFTAMGAVIASALVLSGRSGFWAVLKAGALAPKESFIFICVLVFLAAFAGWFLYSLIQSVRHPGDARAESGLRLLASLWVLGLFWLAVFVGLAPWKVGSNPFGLLREAMANAPVFMLNPDFVPANGNGLNPLLQNYWMVIHPPTLFLGFASTVVPFAFAIAGLMRKEYTGWVRPSSPWLVFSVMILGVGIIMGGYWAYETLSFGGYWNWDPVENASFVPWLTGIASLHGLLAWRKSKSFLGFSILLVVFTFLLVLYSTFLTRSGILGEASVHTFTDLGLSGQLLLLLFVFFGAVFLLYVMRAREIPTGGKDIPFWSQEFFLFLGVLVLLFSSIGITIATSLPVINKIFGANLAPPAEVQFFYYRWNVWFAILFGVLSAIAQFFFWRRMERADLMKSLFRPFLLAILSASAVIILIAVYRMHFAYESKYAEWLESASLADSVMRKIQRYLQFAITGFADELLLAASLFSFFANADILIRLAWKEKVKWGALGGSFSHIGFSLMLIGFLFSSGYDEVVTKNLNPSELGRFDEKERQDNVLLIQNRPRFINGYQVTYKGKLNAKPPVSGIHLLARNEDAFKVSFTDSAGNTYALELPPTNFFIPADSGAPVLDTAFLALYLNERLGFLKPSLINSRSEYEVRFNPLVNATTGEWDEGRSFSLYPEAEINPGMGLIAHPSRKVFWDRDLYVHVSSIPKEDEERKFSNQFLEIGPGEEMPITGGSARLISVKPEEGDSRYELVVKAELLLRIQDSAYVFTPYFRISKSNEVHPGVFWNETAHVLVTFLNVDPDAKKLRFSIQTEENPKEDFIVLKGIHKPWINFTWLGTFILVFGFLLTIARRSKEI